MEHLVLRKPTYRAVPSLRTPPRLVRDPFPVALAGSHWRPPTPPLSRRLAQAHSTGVASDTATTATAAALSRSAATRASAVDTVGSGAAAVTAFGGGRAAIDHCPVALAGGLQPFPPWMTRRGVSISFAGKSFIATVEAAGALCAAAVCLFAVDTSCGGSCYRLEAGYRR